MKNCKTIDLGLHRLRRSRLALQQRLVAARKAGAAPTCCCFASIPT